MQGALRTMPGIHQACRHSLLFIISYMLLNACFIGVVWKGYVPFIDPYSKTITILVSLGQKDFSTQLGYEVPETCLLVCPLEALTRTKTPEGLNYREKAKEILFGDRNHSQLGCVS